MNCRDQNELLILVITRALCVASLISEMGSTGITTYIYFLSLHRT